MLITAMKQGLTQKQLTIFLRENTLLSDQVTELMLEIYSNYGKKKGKVSFDRGAR